MQAENRDGFHVLQSLEFLNSLQKLSYRDVKNFLKAIFFRFLVVFIS